MNVFFSTISFKSRLFVPYPVACLISYCNKDDFFKQKINFLEPEYRFNPLQYQEFHDQLKRSDIIGLTCYVWNQASNDTIAEVYKKYRPDGLVIYGGPNVPGTKIDAQPYANYRPHVDVFFYGPGEKNVKNFLKKYYNNKNIENHEGSYTKRSFTVTISKDNYVVTDTPTPYLDGIFDNILKNSNQISAIIETNRGCPYRCAFCDWGSLTASKIYQFDLDLVKKNIDYSMKFKSVKHMNIVDANFGTFSRDVEIVDYIYDLKIKYHKEKFELLFGGMAKNGSRFLKDIYKKLDNFDVNLHDNEKKNSVKNMRVSLQTLSQEALNTINRKNIKTEKLLDSVKVTKHQSLSSELIVGLPGETVESWLDTLSKHVDLNLGFISGYHLVVLPNTPMYDIDYRRKYNIEYTRVYIPEDLNNLDLSVSAENSKNLFDYKSKFNLKENKFNFNTFEVMHSCYSYSNKELKRMYLYMFWFNTFWNSQLASTYIKESNIPVTDQVHMFFELIDQGKMPFFKSLIEEYKKVLDKIFSNKEVILDDLYTVTFLQKSMGRGTELIKIIDNINIVKNEIKLLFPNFQTNHIKPIINKARLMSAYCSLIE